MENRGTNNSHEQKQSCTSISPIVCPYKSNVATTPPRPLAPFFSCTDGEGEEHPVDLEPFEQRNFLGANVADARLERVLIADPHTSL